MNLFSIKKRTIYEFRFFVSDDIPTHFSCLLQSCSVHHKHVLRIHEIIRAGVIPLNEVNHRLFRFAHYEEAASATHLKQGSANHCEMTGKKNKLSTCLYKHIHIKNVFVKRDK